MEKDFSELSCLAIKSPEVHDKINTPLYIFKNNKHQTLFFCGQFAYVCVLPLHETLLYSMASAYIFEWLFTIIAVQKCKRPSGFTHLSVPSHSPGTSAQTLLSFDISLSACERTGAINPGRFLAAVRFCNLLALSLSLPAIGKATVAGGRALGLEVCPSSHLALPCLETVVPGVFFVQGRNVCIRVACCSHLSDYTMKQAEN